MGHRRSFGVGFDFGDVSRVARVAEAEAETRSSPRFQSPLQLHYRMSQIYRGTCTRVKACVLMHWRFDLIRHVACMRHV